ncbi:hypothetical protein BDZ91DRAFT_744729 [Kalaharituber pfeilii]|nr:hypothetical protein BDZ91DRAFT_744729 [Kalaharituber pfeilii]
MQPTATTTLSEVPSLQTSLDGVLLTLPLGSPTSQVAGAPQPRLRPTPSLIALPPELLSHILNYLRTSARNPSPDLASLSSTCHFLRDFVEPTLYHTIIGTWPSTTFGQSNYIHQYEHRLTYLLRTLVSRPSLASHVRHLRLERWNMPNRDANATEMFRRIFGQRQTEKLEALIRRMKFEFPEGGAWWIYNMVTGSADATAAVLLPMFENLETLTLKIDNGRENQHPVCLWRVLRHLLVNKGLSQFGRLRDVSITTTHSWRMSLDRYDSDLRDLVPLLFLPSIRHLRIFVLDKSLFTWPASLASFAVSSKSPLTSLTLANSKVESLGHLLQACPYLRSLDYTINLLVEFRTSRFFRCRDLSESLSHVRDTLEDLSIHVFTFSAYDDLRLYPLGLQCGPQGDHSLLALHTFPKLRTLTIAPAMLLGLGNSTGWTLGEALPRCLERLWLAQDFKDFEPQWGWERKNVLPLLTEYVLNKEAIAPKLKVVGFEGDKPTPWTRRMRMPVWCTEESWKNAIWPMAETECEDLVQMANRKGVAVEVVEREYAANWFPSPLSF